MTSAKRRRLLIACAAAGAAGVAGGVLWWRTREAELVEVPRPRLPPPADFPNALLVPGAGGMFGVVDASESLAIAAKASRHAIQPGKTAAMLAYEVEQG